MLPVEDRFWDWFSGFVDGEASFLVHVNMRGGYLNPSCQFAIQLREDDKEILEEIVSNLGFGRLYKYENYQATKGHPSVRLVVATKDGCKRLVEILDAHPLRAKKAADYDIWRECVLLWMSSSRAGGNESIWEKMLLLKDRIQDARKFPKKNQRRA